MTDAGLPKRAVVLVKQFAGYKAAPLRDRPMPSPMVPRVIRVPVEPHLRGTRMQVTPHLVAEFV